MHAAKDGSASQCQRYQKMHVKAAKIKANRSRRFEAKKTSVAKVDLRGWNGALKQGTHYTKEAKTLILNLISVRIINIFLLLGYPNPGCYCITHSVDISEVHFHDSMTKMS